MTFRDLVDHPYARAFAIVTVVALKLWWTHRATVPLWWALLGTYLAVAIAAVIWRALDYPLRGLRWVARIWLEMATAEWQKRKARR